MANQTDTTRHDFHGLLKRTGALLAHPQRAILLTISLAVVGTLYFSWLRPDPIHEGKRISVWLNELEADRAGMQGDACQALCRAGLAAVPGLVEGMKAKDDSRFYHWLWPKLPAVAQPYFDRPRQRTTFRRTCAYVLGRIEPSSREIVQELQKTLGSEDPWLVEFAAQALRMILEREPSMLSAVVPATPQLRQLGAQPGETNFQVRRTLHTIAFLESRNGPLLTIFRDWQLRRQREYPMRYHLNRERTWFRNAFAPDRIENPEHGISGSCTQTVLLDISRNRFRVEFDNVEYASDQGVLYRIRCIEVGDGSTLRVQILEDSLASPDGTKPAPRVDFWTATGDPNILPQGIFERGYEPMFFAAGIVPAGERRVRPTALRPTNEMSAFSFGGSRIENGRAHHIIREGEKEYWIDGARDSAIVKLILQRGIQPLVTIDVDYQHTTAGWLPRKWVRNEYRNGIISMTEETEVSHIEVEPSISATEFTLKPMPGMYVKEQRFFLEAQTGRLRSDDTFYLLEAGGARRPVTEELLPAPKK